MKREDEAVAVDHDHAVGRGVEDRAQLAHLGFGGAQRDLGVAQAVGCGGADQREHQRALAVPRHGVEPTLAGERLAGARRDREGLAGAVDAVERAGVRIDDKALEPARRGDGGDVRVAGPFEEGAVGVEQRIGAMDQHADGQAIENGEWSASALFGPRRFGRGRERARQRSVAAAGGLAGSARGSGRRLRRLGRDLRRFAVAERFADLMEGRALDRGQRGRFSGAPAERHHIFRGRHDGEQRTRLRLVRRRCVSRCGVGAAVGCTACAAVPCARDVAAYAEAAIALEGAVAIEDRQAGEFDVHAFRRSRRPATR